MKKVAWILASGALIAACGGGNNRADVGTDTGGIVLMDTGPGRDAFVPMGRDSGPPATMCGPWGGLTATSIAPIPTACLPRCTNATLGAVNMCLMGMDTSCLGPTLMADTTPAIPMSYMDTTIDLDCGTCFDIQRFHCFSEVCPAEASPYLVCQPSMDADMCMGELTALQTCLEGIAMGSAQEMTLNTCFETQVTGCFDTSGGFLPGQAQQLSQLARRFSPRVRPAQF